MGVLGIDDLKCMQLTSYSYPAQLLWQFNCFFSALPIFFCRFFFLLMVTFHGGKGGRTLEEKFSDSEMATTSTVHL